MGKKVTAKQKQQLLTKNMGSLRGRQRIAVSMQEPLRRLRDYVSSGRKAVFKDDLPDGALPIYDKDVDTPAYVVGEEGDNMLTIVKGDRILVPTFEIASHPTIPFSQVKERRFDIVRRVKKKAKDELFRLEDRIIFGALQTAGLNATVNAPINVTAANYDIDSIIDAFANIERHGLRVDKIYMNPAEFRVLRKAGRDYIEFETMRELLRTGFMGTLYGAQIFQSMEVPSGNLMLLSEPEYVGVMPIRMDLTVLPADEPVKRRFGWSLFSNWGLTISNADYGTQLLVVT